MNKSNQLNRMIKYFFCGIILSGCSIGFNYAQPQAPVPCGP